MKNLNRLCAFLFLAGILFSAFSPFVFAQQPDREITYPVLENCPPGTPPAQCAETPNTTRELPKIIRYLFNFGLVVSGFVAFGALVYGGVRYLFSAGNPGALGEARDQVLAAILGIAVLFSSYMLLTTINPQLVVLSLPASGATKGGIVLYSQQGCIDQGEEGKDFIHAKSMLSDLPDSFNRTFDNQGNINGDKPVQSVRFLSPPEEVNVTLYPKDNYSSGNQSDLVWKSEQHLDEILNSSTRCVAVGKVVDSVNLEWRSPGIYLFAENDCKGDARLYVGNTSNFGDFDNKARSLMIIPTLEKVLLPGPVLPGEAQAYASQVKAKLGAILYENENFKDDAAVFLGGEVPKLDDPDYNKKLKPDCIDFDKLKSCSTTQDPYCKEAIGSSASSLRVFQQNIAKQNPGGEGVIVWGNYQWNEQAKGDRSGDQQIHCGAINAVNSEGTLGSGKPLWVNSSSANFNSPPNDKRYAGTDNESKENCKNQFLLTGIFETPPGPGAMKPPSMVSSISVDGNYMGVLFNADGRGEAFLAPGDIRLRDNHIGDDQAKYLLVIPLQSN